MTTCPILIGCGTLVDRRALIDPLMRTRRIRRRRLDGDRRALETRNAMLMPLGSVTRGQTVGADAEARDIAHRINGLFQLLLVGGAPDDFAHRVAGFDRRRQIARILGPDDHLGAVAGAIDKFVGCGRHLRHAPIVKEALCFGHVADAEYDSINTRKRHHASPSKQTRSSDDYNRHALRRQRLTFASG